MPFAACAPCDRFFALDNERSPQTHCPRCEQPLRLLPREQVVDALRRLQMRRSVPSASPDGSPADPDRSRPPPIPDAQMAILAGTIVEVVELAAHAQGEEGGTCLIHALCYAEQSRIEGHRWGEALIERYSDVIDTYSQRYRIRLE